MAIAGVISLVAVVGAVASLAWLHLQPTGLSPLRNAVSQYGITPFRAGYRVATIAFGAAGLALAIGIDRAISASGRTSVVVLLVVFAAARGAISWFPMDAPGLPRTPTGMAHGLLAFAAFASVAAAAFELGHALAHATRWHSLEGVSTALGWAMLACLLGVWLARAHPAVRALFGAIERGFYICAIAWVAVFAFACAASVH
jgi:hypothetical protein